ncbi:hypothetical protein HRJ34_15090 [Rhizorhabdus wittichii]|uniref:Uncharacterized protein n=1 Tax=Rhizorhabdus wittichii TaxID=160791 RepID=A0A975HBU4_9SPHN|nr:hypothetical protein [Rhizorhabdus wittichii]QTH19696.1 hypothetical protein HRJ34_15090 [Rhizorhabdus wittichii]
MSALRPHIRAARALAEAFAFEANETGDERNGLLLCRISAAYSRAAKSMEAIAEADSYAAYDDRLAALSRELGKAEAELISVRSAPDSANYHGRSRTEAAQREVKRLRDEVDRHLKSGPDPVVIHRQSAGQTAEALAGWPVQREGC